ncbi:LiaF transmembrane domain-containing protein [Pedobacter sp.]|uniref:LiaF transmembrane domain-containing protein n=1 Tax=Pedobacter sp. TaxID=1411316 RepID=UPI003D7FB20A
MENKDNIQAPVSNNRTWGGIIILVIGLVFLLRNFGIYVPGWLFSWSTLLLGIGLYVGFKRNFTGAGWLVMVLIGGYFTINDMVDFDLGKYYFAFALIALGLFLILKPKYSVKSKINSRLSYQQVAEPLPDTFEDKGPLGGEEAIIDKSEVIEAVSVFGGASQKVFSKNLKGGEIIAVFGGSEINLTQANFENSIVIEVVAIFGGIKIILPPTWEVKSEVVAIFGGMDDKRAIMPFGDGPRKIVVIKGVALFGGVDIRNY